MSDPRDDMRSRNRWAAITFARMGGVVLVVLALLMLNGKIGGSAPFGYVLLAAGLAGAFVVPQMLAKKWRSPPE